MTCLSFGDEKQKNLNAQVVLHGRHKLGGSCSAFRESWIKWDILDDSYLSLLWKKKENWVEEAKKKRNKKSEKAKKQKSGKYKASLHLRFFTSSLWSCFAASFVHSFTPSYLRYCASLEKQESQGTRKTRRLKTRRSEKKSRSDEVKKLRSKEAKRRKSKQSGKAKKWGAHSFSRFLASLLLVFSRFFVFLLPRCFAC